VTPLQKAPIILERYRAGFRQWNGQHAGRRRDGFNSGSAWPSSHVEFFIVIATITGIAGFVVALRAIRQRRAPCIFKENSSSRTNIKIII
jgi:hypothetical protein